MISLINCNINHCVLFFKNNIYKNDFKKVNLLKNYIKYNSTLCKKL